LLSLASNHNPLHLSTCLAWDIRCAPVCNSYWLRCGLVNILSRLASNLDTPILASQVVRLTGMSHWPQLGVSFIRALIPFMRIPLLQCNQLLKDSPLNTTTFGIMISTHVFRRNRNIYTIVQDHNIHNFTYTFSIWIHFFPYFFFFSFLFFVIMVRLSSTLLN
jgi:hypothetical protein